MIKSVVFFQFRLGSSRSPGKARADSGRHPMLWHHCKRVWKARSAEKVVVNTGDCPLVAPKIIEQVKQLAMEKTFH